MPAMAPEIDSARHVTLPTCTPAYSAACGCNPTARSSNPRRVRKRNHQSAIIASSASRMVALAAEPWNDGTTSDTRGSTPLPISAVCSVSGTCSLVDVR